MKSTLATSVLLAGSLLVNNMSLASENNYFGLLLIEDEDTGDVIPAPVLSQIGSPEALGGRVVLTIDDDLEIDDYIQRKDKNDNSVNISQCQKQASGITQCAFAGTVDEDAITGTMNFAFTKNGKAFLGSWIATGESKSQPMYGANFPEYLWLEEAAEPNWMRFSHGMFQGSARLNAESASRPTRVTLNADREGHWNGVIWIEESAGPIVYTLSNCNSKKRRKMVCDQTDAKGKKLQVQLSFNRRGNSFKAQPIGKGEAYSFRAVRLSWED